jgi:hypothetical protein
MKHTIRRSTAHNYIGCRTCQPQWFFLVANTHYFAKLLFLERLKENRVSSLPFFQLVTSLNLVPNAQVCMYLTVHIKKLQLQTTFPKPLYLSHSACIHRDTGR